MANIKYTDNKMIRRFAIPIIDCVKEVTIIFIYSFLVMIRSGRRVRSSLSMLKFKFENIISTIEKHTIIKSNLFQGFPKYDSSPTIKPRAIILSKHSAINIKLRLKSNNFDI